MAVESPLQQLFNRQVTRKEFLSLAGLALLSLLGFSSIIRLLSGHSPHERFHGKARPGYGRGDYGA